MTSTYLLTCSAEVLLNINVLLKFGLNINILLKVLLNINILLNQDEAGSRACIWTRWPRLLPFKTTEFGSEGCSTTSASFESHSLV
jgi:hypothetical protein